MSNVLTSRRPSTAASWLLVLSPIVFVVTAAASISTAVAAGGSTAADVTPAQMQEIRLELVVFLCCYLCAVLAGSIGMVLLNNWLLRSVPSKLAMASQVAVALSVLCVTGRLILGIVLIDFTEPRMGLNPLAAPAEILSVSAIWFAEIAVLLTGLALYRTGLLRRTGLLVSSVAGVAVLVDLLTGGALPPFVVSFLWLAFGIAMLRRDLPSSV